MEPPDDAAQDASGSRPPLTHAEVVQGGAHLVHPAFVLVKNHRGIYVGQNVTALSIMGDTLGLHHGTKLTGDFFSKIAEAHSRVLATKRPDLNHLLPYISPFTCERRWFRLDLYPIFDDVGNVTNVTYYGNDFTDRHSLPSSLSLGLASVASAAQLITAALRDVKTRRFNGDNVKIMQVVQRLEKDFAAAIRSSFVQYAHESSFDALRRPELKIVYCGNIILSIAATFADSFEDMTTEPRPVLSLQINPDANLYCISDVFYLELIFRHAIEAFALMTPTVFEAIVTNEGTFFTFEVKSSRLPNNALGVASQQHLKTIETMIAAVNGEFVSESLPFPMLKCSFPLYLEPIHLPRCPDYEAVAFSSRSPQVADPRCEQLPSEYLQEYDGVSEDDDDDDDEEPVTWKFHMLTSKPTKRPKKKRSRGALEASSINSSSTPPNPPQSVSGKGRPLRASFSTSSASATDPPSHSLHAHRRK